MAKSISVNVATLNRSVGYGNMAYHISKTLNELGRSVHVNDTDACIKEQGDTSLWFCQPEHWTPPGKDSYNIAYLPWESTALPSHWAPALARMDEVWTTSSWVKQVFEDNDIEVKKVYPHGIDHFWEPKEREAQDKVRFLFQGAPDARKNGQMAYEAFRKAFGDSKNVELVIKSRGASGIKQTMPGNHDNVRLIWQDCSEEQLRGLYYKCDAMVYPSSGEGFGTIPFQALATGMPVAMTSEWAEYLSWVPYRIDAKQVPSKWPQHPGLVYMPDMDDVVNAYKYLYDQIDMLQAEQVESAKRLHETFDWKLLTKTAFNIWDPLTD